MPTAKVDNTSTEREARYAIGATREERYESARKALATARGRPRKGSKSPGSRARSLRLPDATWHDLDVAAKARKMTTHRFLRVIIAERLYTQSTGELKAERASVKARAVPKARKRARKAA